MNIGPQLTAANQAVFTVWAPLRERVELHIVSPDDQYHLMNKDEHGYWHITLDDPGPDTRYFYRLDGEAERPDPASPFQPDGVHGPSAVVDHAAFPWSDAAWRNIPLAEWIIYELHVGTFTDEGAFAAVIPRLPELREFGVNVLEIMPVAQFPGSRNWGYDGVYPFAVQNSYGGPEGLKVLVDACHTAGIAVVLDVVYNHFGPEGNYLHGYGPYFTKKYHTPWGEAVNFDDAYSDGVRQYFIQNALHWLDNYHIDGLRLDAVHAIFDNSAKPFLQELHEEVSRWSADRDKPVVLIAESDLNDVRVICGREEGGFGMEAQWSDDFHHAVHALLTGERRGYYADFGHIRDLRKAMAESFVYDWKYSVHRKRRHGSRAVGRPAQQFIVSLQNHDQVGNRMLGDRLSTLVPYEAQKLAAGVMMFSPYIPMIFMGEEYGEQNPFYYFVSHSDAALIEAVRNGRKEEFSDFLWQGAPPDPQAEETFLASKIAWQQRSGDKYGPLREYWRELIRLRTVCPGLKNLCRENMKILCWETQNVLYVKRWAADDCVVFVANFSPDPQSVTMEDDDGRWTLLLDSCHGCWNGPGSSLNNETGFEAPLPLGPYQFAAYQRTT